jgi:hypothetical protein
MKIARRLKAPVPRKPSQCPICHSRSGFCVVGVTFVPPQWWGSRRSTRRTPK